MIERGEESIALRLIKALPESLMHLYLQEKKEIYDTVKYETIRSAEVRQLNLENLILCQPEDFRLPNFIRKYITSREIFIETSC